MAGAVIEAAFNAGRGLPDSFAEIEEIQEPWMWFFISAFFALSTERPVSFSGVAPLPWSKVEQYADAYSFNGGLRSLFRSIIRDMDAHYIQYKEGQQKVEEARRTAEAKRAAQKAAPRRRK